MANWEEMLDPLGKYYILLKESTGKCYGRMNFLQKLIPPYVEQPDIDFNAEMGTLYEKAPDEMQPSSKSMIGLVSIENSDSFICYLVIQLSDTKEINFKELKLLLAVISKDERVATAMNACQFKRASLAEVGDKVLVKRVFRDSMDDLKCFVIKSIQHSGKGNGHYFYISLKGNDERNRSKWQCYAVNHLFFLDKPNPVILETKKYYVLNDKNCAIIFDEDKPIEIVDIEKGTILTESDAGKESVNKDIMCLTLFDQKDFIVETTYNKVFDICYAEANFLVAIDNPSERLRVLEDQEQLEYAIHAKIGDLVHVDGKINQISGIGPSQGKTGLYFHVTQMDPKHAASTDQKVVPFNQVQHIKEEPENTNPEQEKLEKSAQGCVKGDGKYDNRPPKEVNYSDAKKQGSRSKDLIEKRLFVPDQEVCGTVKYAASSKLLCDMEEDRVVKEQLGNFCKSKLFESKPEKSRKRKSKDFNGKPEFLSGMCEHGIMCNMKHSTYGKPYLWQFKQDGKLNWNNTSLELNDDIGNQFKSHTSNTLFNGTISYPLHWPTNQSKVQKIPVAGKLYFDLLTQFFDSVKAVVEVENIMEIINHDVFERYLSKKDKLKRRTDSLNEKFLYHGTAPNIVEAICAQNFDFRLHGHNGTRFGKGSYFAKEASYSHKFSIPDYNGFCYMFIAQVLVGEYTQGHPSLRRPPVKPSTQFDLYDSCVNDVKNPSIFVVFELDQCYPRYLLKYRLFK